MASGEPVAEAAAAAKRRAEERTVSSEQRIAQVLARDGQPYAVLQLERSAAAAEVRKAYRAAALLVHPDKAPKCAGACAAFEAIEAAQALLLDPAARRTYDAAHPPAFTRPSAHGSTHSSGAHARSEMNVRSREAGDFTDETATAEPVPTPFQPRVGDVVEAKWSLNSRRPSSHNPHFPPILHAPSPPPYFMPHSPHMSRPYSLPDATSHCPHASPDPSTRICRTRWSSACILSLDAESGYARLRFDGYDDTVLIRLVQIRAARPVELDREIDAAATAESAGGCTAPPAPPPLTPPAPPLLPPHSHPTPTPLPLPPHP